MKVVIQRVNYASVSVENKLISKINKGLLIFVGIGKNDNQKDIEYIIRKILNLRIFDTTEKFMDKNVKDLDLEILSVSQFTLCVNFRKGNRPSFDMSMPSKEAAKFYRKFFLKLKEKYPKAKDGIFGAYMDIKLSNDGPVTIILDSK
ncbi:D-tyrosyl-tRNA(Tyr) deacylase [Candidatus Dependentiae bacterium]|nr:D-tyrosyl-tRNA(Tyr) deacylase [Candidatus Dependentiae bacterium]